MTISAPIQRLIDATNAGDSAAFVACFTDDCYLEDWGRVFHGHEGAASWDRTDNIGKQSRFEPLGERVEPGEHGDDHIVTLVVTGNGFTGTSDIVFGIEGDLVSRLVIAAE